MVTLFFEVVRGTPTSRRSFTQMTVVSGTWLTLYVNQVDASVHEFSCAKAMKRRQGGWDGFLRSRGTELLPSIFLDGLCRCRARERAEPGRGGPWLDQVARLISGTGDGDQGTRLTLGLRETGTECPEASGLLAPEVGELRDRGRDRRCKVRGVGRGSLGAVRDAYHGCEVAPRVAFDVRRPILRENGPKRRG